MRLMNDIDYVELFARKLKENNKLFGQQKMIINSQLKSSKELFRKMFGNDFKLNARIYLKKRGLIK